MSLQPIKKPTGGVLAVGFFLGCSLALPILSRPLASSLATVRGGSAAAIYCRPLRHIMFK
ncbi:MAG: hypothetical protein II674_09545 [Prevotella sp.]|nr:hypothetical protein [Prevotella sp.]MBQ4294976.1 hypothetical protein [Prevotella sp.]